MATWVSHLMIADSVLQRFPELDRHGFCVGNIAPDCNVENEDWSSFTPSREVTHWMSGRRKKASDCDRFYLECIEKRRKDIKTNEEYSFLLGYYAHLITDAEFQRFIRDEERVALVWKRILGHPALAEKASGMPGDWDSIKKLFAKDDRMKDIYSIEAEYLERHPESGYFTEILNLKTFPRYIDYLPEGAIVRKIGIMGYLPRKEAGEYPGLAMSKEEYLYFTDRATELVIRALAGIRGQGRWISFTKPAIYTHDLKHLPNEMDNE
ncbi:MAG: zinc dependent phospholipase C family protein [Lachnospiraceae bacterium]|jgi:hypothetical protein|nr:zinc dependent phospholipase C family protein [Lachnospiraceae bacterium]